MDMTIYQDPGVLDSSVRVSVYRQGVLIPTYTMDRGLYGCRHCLYYVLY